MASKVSADGTKAAAGGKGRGSNLLLIAGAALSLTVAGVVGTQIMPGVMSIGAANAQTAQDAKPVFVDVPEMALTLPNDGQPRQLRIKLSLELGRPVPGQLSPDQLMPRVYDAMLTYLRTAHDDELAGSLALDHLRGDLLRRLDLVLGEGAVREVLITNLVIG